MASPILARRLTAVAAALLLAGSCHSIAGLDGVDDVGVAGQLAQGEGCQTANQCLGGNCVDGFCCESSCSGVCESCAGEVPGVCGLRPSGANDDQCMNGLCDGAGQCASGAPVRVRTYSGNGQQFVSRIMYDSVGNQLVTGHFQGTVDFGDGDVTVQEEAVFVIKYSPNGAVLWKTIFNTKLAASIENQVLAVNAEDDVYVAGGFGDYVQIGTQSFVGPESRNTYVAKLAGVSGEVSGATSLGSTGEQYVISLAVGASGQVRLLAGYYDGAWVLPPKTLPVPVYGVDVALITLLPNLSFGDIRSIAGTSNDLPRDMVADAEGNTVIVGRFEGTLSLAGAPAPLVANGRDVFVIKLRPNGGFACSNSFGSGATMANDFDEPFKLRLDSQGNIWVMGRSDAGLTLGNGTTLPHGGGFDVWLVKLDSECLLLDAVNVSEAPGDESGKGMTIDKWDNLIVTYDQLENPAGFGGGPLPAFGGLDAVIAKFASDGTHLWSAAYGDDADQLFQVVATDDAGDIHVAGAFQGEFTIGGDTLVGTESASDNVNDAFVATFAP